MILLQTGPLRAPFAFAGGYGTLRAGKKASVLLERPVRGITGEIVVSQRRPLRLGRYAPAFAALVTLALHAAGNPHYGFFRDELYFIICGMRPDLGYVDQPSLAPLLAAFSQTMGISLFALRVIPAVFAAVATYAACIVAVELGGGLFAIIIAALVTIVSPEMMAFGSRLSPDMVEVATWSFIALIALRISKGADQRWWLAAGALVAFAAWSKYSVAFFAVALIIGMLLTPQRAAMRSRWFAAGVALSVVLVLPNVWWQWHYHFPILQLLSNDYDKFLLKWPPFALQQIMVMSPLLSIVWLVGLGWLLYHRRTRFLGYAYIALIAMMWALDAKAYYPAPVYPYLIAAGAVPIERWTGVRYAWRVAIIAVVVAFAIPSTPFVLPVLPMRMYMAYQQVVGNLFHIRFHVDKGATNATPIQYYADMTGWPELAQTVHYSYLTLTPPERKDTAIYAHNFGEASAIDFFGARYRLPPALSGNNNYWIWGTHGYSGKIVIDVNGPELLPHYRSVRRVATFHNPLAMPYENDLPIWILRDPRAPLSALWPSLRNYSYGFGGL